MFPKDGYWFRESDGTIIKGSSWKLVTKKVVEYRERAKMSPGNPAVEVAEQACARQPTICHNVVKYEPAKRPLSLKSRVLKWLSEFKLRVAKGEKLEYVADAEAKARADACAQCSANVPLGPSSCSACKQAVTEMRKSIIGPRRADGRLNGCNFLGIDLPTAVHLDEIRLDNNELPAHCWRKKSV
jgi:hypothetical protein